MLSTEIRVDKFDPIPFGNKEGFILPGIYKPSVIFHDKMGIFLYEETNQLKYR